MFTFISVMNASSYNHTHYDQILYNVTCSGNESGLSNCPHNSWVKQPEQEECEEIVAVRCKGMPELVTLTLNVIDFSCSCISDY